MAIIVIGTVRYGTTGTDNFNGGSWNDVFHMTADDYITDNINGEAGTDTVDYTPSQVGVKITLTDAPLKGGLPTGGMVEADFAKILYNYTTHTYTYSNHHQVVADLTSIENATGSNFNDVLIGNSANNVLSGGAGNDVINGGAGSDIIIGGAGIDTLYGGNDTAVDTFKFSDFHDSPYDNGMDSIMDFHPGQDRIDLSGINAQVTGGAHLHWIDTETTTIDQFSGHAGEVQFGGPYFGGSNGLVEYVQVRIDVDGDKTADFYLNVVTDPSAGLDYAKYSDFILV